MSKDLWTEVDQYYTELFVKPDPRFEQINQASLDAGLPSIQITPNQGKFLELLVRLQGAKRVLEIGTLGGFSTAWLASGLPAGGKLISLEINPEHTVQAEKNLALFEFKSELIILQGDGLVLLQEMVEIETEPFDLVFIDATKEQYADYLDWILPLSRPGTIIIADNVVRGGRILDQNSEDNSVRGIQEFNQKVAADTRLSATVLQTVGEKGYDGFTFIIVN
jgi:predicted O-methyltransferase YrrM